MSKRPRPWQQDVPTHLIQAVSFLRESFDQSVFEIEVPTKALCFLRLHDGDSGEIARYAAKLEKIKGIVGLEDAERFDEMMAIGTLPAIFHGFHELFLRAMAVSIGATFANLVAIEAANADALGSANLEWPERQAKDMIQTTAPRMKTWIREVCDRQEPYDSTKGDLDAWLYWEDWRAPSFVIRRNKFNPISNPTRDWARESEENTDFLLCDFAKHCVARNEAALSRTVGGVALVRAKKSAQIAAAPPAGAPAIETKDVQPSTTNSTPSKLKKWKDSARHAKIYRAICMGLTGLKYCKYLDQHQVSPPADWARNSEWPGTYAAVYGLSVKIKAKWLKKITSEKNKHNLE